MFQRKYLECYRTLRAICGNRNFNSVHFHFFYIKSPEAALKSIHTAIPVIAGTATETRVHFRLPVSFFIVIIVVAQGQCISEKRIKHMAVVKSQPFAASTCESWSIPETSDSIP